MKNMSIHLYDMLCDVHGDKSFVSNILALHHGIQLSKFNDCWRHILEDL
jgi:hypothetical protein